MGCEPFIGSAALAAGDVSHHELRRYYRAIMPNVYLDKRVAADAATTEHGRLALVAAGSGDRRLGGVVDARQ